MSNIKCIYITHIYRYGFGLIGYKGRIEFYTTSETQQRKWLRALRRVAILSDIQNKYQFGKLIGKGNFAKVLYYKNYLISRCIKRKKYQKEM